MTDDRAADLVRKFYAKVLRREPTPAEVRQGTTALAAHANDAVAMLEALTEMPQVQQALGVPSRWPAGHFYSPIVDPSSVASYVQAERLRSARSVAGIPLDFDGMRSLWLDNLDVVRTSPFRQEQSPTHRYYAAGGPYPLGDAIILRMMIHHARPRRIVEIGSGYTTACILDSVEELGSGFPEITCIEPAAARLRSLMRDGDLDRLTLIERPIQEIPAEIVDPLQSGDILLIDSTHVLKTGSDVHYELFSLLPRLARGVLVHVHDIMPGFEYPDAWIAQNYSWNEAYAWRAFLMYNSDFRVVFWNAPFARAFRTELRGECPAIFPNPGSALWIERSRIGA